MGLFLRGNKGPVVPVPGSMTGIRYKYFRIVKCYLPSVLRSALIIYPYVSFQHDNAPVHTARIITEWFDHNNIELEAHPPYSPDLNPIEHVWVELKKRLQQQYPGIADTRGGPPAIKRELARILPLVWETIPPEFFEKTAASMPQRVEAVIQAKGWYTKY